MRIRFTFLFATLLSSSSIEAIKVLESETNDSERLQMAQAHSIVEAALKSTASSLSDSAIELTTEAQPSVDLELNSTAEPTTDSKMEPEEKAIAGNAALAPNGRPNGAITIIDAHRSVHQGNPQLNAQLQQSITLLNQLLSAMLGGGGGMGNQQAMMAQQMYNGMGMGMGMGANGMMGGANGMLGADMMGMDAPAIILKDNMAIN